jgi:DNA repair photolyase
MTPLPPAPRGRGAARDVPNRFEALRFEVDREAEPDAYLDPESGEPLPPRVPTRFFRDESQSVISHNHSPDLSFDLSLNPYRGCEHGCAYCYARPYHEFLGFSAGLDFESKIMVKPDAPELLRAEISRPSHKPGNLAMSGVTDPYQPVERRLRLTRRCLEVLCEFRHPVGAITKNHLVARDADLYAELASHGAAVAMVSVTTLDSDLARDLEPRASSPRQRLAAVAALAAAGVPTGVSVAPVIPGLTDHEIPSILEAAAAAGAQFATYGVLRLPYAVEDIFKEWLERHRPGAAAKVLDRLRSLRGGHALNDSTFGQRFRGTGIWATHLAALFQSASRRHGIGLRAPAVSTAAFRRRLRDQPELF